MSRLAAFADAAGLTEAEARDVLRRRIDEQARTRLGATASRARTSWTREEIVVAVTTFVERERRMPTPADLVPPGMPSPRTLARRFPSIAAAVEAAGIEVYEVEQTTLFGTTSSRTLDTAGDLV